LKKFFYFFIILIPILAVSISFYPTDALVVNDGHTSHTFMIGDGFNITIYYIHSVERSPIYEVLWVNSTGIYAIQMRWKDFGAGLPEDIQYVDAQGFYVKNIDIYLGKNLSFWFIPINQAHIWVDGVLVFTPHTPTLVNFTIERTMIISTL